MQIPFLDLKALHGEIREEIVETLERVLDSGTFIGGQEVRRFEEKFADWVSPGSFALGCANGTDALLLAAKSLQLAPGSEAIVPAMTYVATVEALLHAGLRVRLVDVQPGTWTMDPENVAAAVGSRTRLLVPVHLYGQMAPMDLLRKIADEKGLKVLEDASQAHGATWKDRPVGEFGDLATFSFYPSKNLGALGDAGMILTRNPMLATRCTLLRNHGGAQQNEHEVVGYNSRLDPLQAAVLNTKLQYLNAWNEKRRRVAAGYGEALADLTEVSLPQIAPGATHVFHLYVILVDKRDELAAFLKARGVHTGHHYPRAIHEQPAFAAEDFATERFPNAELLARRGLSLPIGPELTEESIRYIAGSIKEFYGKVSK